MPVKAAPTAKPSGPPEGLGTSVIHRLYRGVIGEIGGKPGRIWAEFPALVLCWAPHDTPAREADQVSLLELVRCTLDDVDVPAGAAPVERQITGIGLEAAKVKLAVFVRKGSLQKAPTSPASAPSTNATEEVEAVNISGGVTAVHDFGVSLQQLIACRNTEGQSGLQFIQKRLFQYLWKHQGESKSELALYEAQAVLAFNLEPKAGIAYVKSRLGKATNEDLGEWLANLSTQKGGLDPTILGDYFSRRDTMEIFKCFVRCLDFRDCDIVQALRRLFDTFKPGGEGQVITRILELFSEAYFLQWSTAGKLKAGNKINYKDADSVLSVGVSLIMLNTTLHVASKKISKNAARACQMTVDGYICMVRGGVDESQVPTESLAQWFDAIKESEISMQPLPRVAFSQLPVQPDIEGWLILAVSPTVQKRVWAVLALRRVYFFSDDSEVEPWEAIDLKDKKVQPVANDAAARASFVADLQRKGCFAGCLPGGGRASAYLTPEDSMNKAFEIRIVDAYSASMLKRLNKPRKRLAVVAEDPDLMDRWVNLITSGPY